jgi:hypothetical protein
MRQELPAVSHLNFFPKKPKLLNLALGLFLPFVAVMVVSGLALPREQEEIQDITGKYHFISADDRLALLEEEGRLHGYIDVYQSEEESDTVLSYTITSGSHQKDHVEFKTNKIHQKYFRFAGTVQRGNGHEEKDPDYLRLVGDLEIIATKGGSQEEVVQRMHLVLKSLGKEEGEEE